MTVIRKNPARPVRSTRSARPVRHVRSAVVHPARSAPTVVRPARSARHVRPAPVVRSTAAIGGLATGVTLAAVDALHPRRITYANHTPHGTTVVHENGPRVGWRGGLIAFGIVCAILAFALVFISPLFLILLAVPVICGGIVLTVHLVEKHNEEKDAQQSKQQQAQSQESITAQNQREAFTGSGQKLGDGRPTTNNNDVQSSPAANAVDSEAAEAAAAA